MREEGIAVLHDRRIPGSRANIDHLVIAASGVWIVDAKNYKGRVERRVRGGLFSREDRLYIGGRDKTSLVDGMAKQVEVVRTALESCEGDVPIGQAICFTAADWSLFRPAAPLRERPRALAGRAHQAAALGRAVDISHG